MSFLVNKKGLNSLVIPIYGVLHSFFVSIPLVAFNKKFINGNESISFIRKMKNNQIIKRVICISIHKHSQIHTHRTHYRKKVRPENRNNCDRERQREREILYKIKNDLVEFILFHFVATGNLICGKRKPRTSYSSFFLFSPTNKKDSKEFLYLERNTKKKTHTHFWRMQTREENSHTK